MNKMNYANAVLKHMKEHGTISSIEAMHMYGITCLRCIIYKLRKKGYDIQTEMRDTTTRYGYKTSYAVYSLKEEKNQNEE